MSQSIELVVSEFLQRRTSIPRIGPADHLFNSGIVNSLFVLELLSFLESRFEIEFAMTDLNLEQFSTVERIARLVDDKQRGGQRAIT